MSCAWSLAASPTRAVNPILRNESASAGRSLPRRQRWASGTGRCGTARRRCETGQDARSDAKLKLLSGLLGVGLDELKLREKQRQRAGQRLSFLFVAVFGTALRWTDGVIPPLRSYVFDAYQTLMPRNVVSLPVTIVEIDQKSLVALGQWPWPRTELARLIDRINLQKPAALGINILMPEADAQSPEQLVDRLHIQNPALAAALRALPMSDAVLARSLQRGPSVLAIAATTELTTSRLHVAPYE